MNHFQSTAIERVKRRVRNFLQTQEAECTAEEICRKVVGRRSYITSALQILSNEGIIQQIGDGVKCDPRKYRMLSRAPGYHQKNFVFQNHEEKSDPLEIII